MADPNRSKSLPKHTLMWYK